MKSPKNIFYTPDIIDDHLNGRYGRLEIEADITLPGGNPASLRKSITPVKIRFLALVFALAFIAIVFRLFALQVLSGGEYRQKAENNRIKVEKVTAARGIVYDKNNRPLVNNSPNFTLYFIPSDLPKEAGSLRTLAESLSAILETPADAISASFSSADKISSQPSLIKEYIGYDQALRLKILINNYPFLNLDIQLVREYQVNEAFSHILGYMGKVSPEEREDDPEYDILDYSGKTGLESFYEDELKGVDGRQQIERDSFNKSKRIIATKESVPGKNLVLTVDAGLQEAVYGALKNAVSQNRAKGGAAIALNPNTGQILALVSYPSFDNNLFYKGISEENFKKITENSANPFINRVISGEYPSGSTIKPTIAAAALQEKIITPSTTVLSVGGIAIDKWFFPDWKAGGHGVTNVVKAIAESVNTFFYALSGGYQEISGLGLETMVKYFKIFGLGEKSGIDLPGEKTGFLPNKEWKKQVKNESWYIGDTYHIGIGQGDILVTPLQVANFTSAIANGGTVYSPYIVDRFTDFENTTVKQESPKIISEKFISPANLDTVKKGMREAVISGSARSLSNLPFSVAGKTGSAQFATNKTTHAWFTCFAPYENPEIVVTVILEEGGEGNVAAIPVAREALTWYFSHK